VQGYAYARKPSLNCCVSKPTNHRRDNDQAIASTTPSKDKMSRLMIKSFFPVNLAKAESYWLGDYLLNGLLFPPHVFELCPEVVVTFYGSSPVRQPALAVSATLGMIVGLKGGYDLWKLVEVSRMTASKAEFTKRRLRPRPTTRLWALAFAAFGIMNMSAIPLHCLLPAPKTTYPKEVRYA
jgi:hypothetical protein